MASRSANEPVAYAIKTATATDTVKSIDYTNRLITLESPDGERETYHAGPSVINFDQIHVGNQVRATVAKALAVSVRKAGTPPNEGESTTVALAPKGEKPGILVTKTEEATSKIMDVNHTDRTITLAQLAGGPKTVQLAPDVDISGLKKGDGVVVRYTDAFAISVQKPGQTEQDSGAR
jgi:hypothetical protein